MKKTFAWVLLAGATALAETITVPAGETLKIPAGRTFTGDVLVKDGAGLLDLSGAVLQNKGLDIRDGAVKFTGGGAASATTRHVQLKVTATQPEGVGKDSGWQISDLLLYFQGKPVAFPAGTTAEGDHPTWREGPGRALDGNPKTKYYTTCGRTLDVYFGAPVTFDAYGWATANDCPGRDPRDWTFSIGQVGRDRVNWAPADARKGYKPPAKRYTPIPDRFPVRLADVLPADYPVTIGGKGRLVLENLSELLEDVAGDGLIELVNSDLTLDARTAFMGSVTGGGQVNW